MAITASDTIMPSFATVTLVFADDASSTDACTATTTELPQQPSHSKMMRVPIGPRTTIRELAKGAMTRFMFSLRRSAHSADLVARHLCKTGIVVTDVHLLTTASDAKKMSVPSADASRGSPSNHAKSTALPSPIKIELFSDDCVTQVVQVRDEVVYMTFRAATGLPNEKKKKKPEDSGNKAAAAGAPERKASAPSATTFAPLSKPATPAFASVFDLTAMLAEHSATTTMTTDEEVACGGLEEVSKDGISMSVPFPTKSTFLSAVDEEATPPLRPKTPHDATVSVSSHDSASSDSSSTGSDSEEEEENIARSIATLRQVETRRMRWGPDAHKHFATNYVNSPQKIMTGRYNSKRQQPRPSVKLNDHSTSQKAAPSAVSENNVIGAAVTEGSEKNQRRRSGADDAVSSPPCKSARVDELSSCDHSQVSVAMSCGTSSPSVTPNTQSRSAVQSRAFPPESPRAGSPPPLIEEKENEGSDVPATAVHSREPNHAVLPDLADTSGVVSSTPVDAIMKSSDVLSNADPGTVAKPLQRVTARQLSFEEDGGHDTQKTLSLTDSPTDTATGRMVPPVQVLSIERMIHTS